MGDISELRAQLERLRKMRASGISKSTYPETGSIEYRTDAEMRQAIVDLQAEIDRLENAPRTKRVVIRTEKGW